MSTEGVPAASPDSAPTPDTCAHIISRKKRQCRLQPLQHSTYCAEHSLQHDDPQHSHITPCPLDPKHFILKSKLSAHLKVCNSAKYDYTDKPYYKLDVNVPGACDAGTTPVKRAPLSSVCASVVMSVCLRLLQYGTLSRVAETGVAETVSEQELERFRQLHQGAELGHEATKHAVQQVALVALLEDLYRAQLRIPPFKNTCFVELGAGTGKMSQWFDVLDEDKQNFFVLVDRKNCRRKADRYFKYSHTNFVRFKMDIKDIDIFGVPEVMKYDNVCLVCKHLCGAATDLSLRSTCNSKPDKNVVVLIALCCHHLCSWELYTGKRYFLKHFEGEEFYILSSLSAWATCKKIEKIQTHDEKLIKEEIEKFTSQPEKHIEDGHLILDKNLRWYIGRCAKNVINDGRAAFMEEMGFSVYFNGYVDVAVSPENTAMLCVKKV